MQSRRIKNNIESYYIDLINKDKLLLCNIPNEFITDQISLLAVQKNWEALSYVPDKNKTTEVYLAALLQNWNLIHDISSQKITDIIYLLLQQVHLNTTENVYAIETFLKDNSTLQLTFCHSLYSLFKLNFLDQHSLNIILEKTPTINKCCESRIKGGAGLTTEDSIDKQKRWALYCFGVEKKIMEKLTQGGSLKEIFDYVSRVRNSIAVNEKTLGADYFGVIRFNRIIGDIYCQEHGKSAVNPVIFKDLFEIAYEAVNDCQKNENIVGNEKTIEACFKLEHTICQLPIEKIKLTYQNDQPLKIETTFAFLKLKNDLYQLLDMLDKKLFRQIISTKNTSDDLLYNVGLLVFHLVRLYPLFRGTGACIQWLARGILQFHFGKDLGDINLGKEQNIPYDVFAQFIQNPNEYALAFKMVVKKMLGLEKTMENMQEINKIPADTINQINSTCNEEESDDDLSDDKIDDGEFDLSQIDGLDKNNSNPLIIHSANFRVEMTKDLSTDKINNTCIPMGEFAIMNAMPNVNYNSIFSKRDELQEPLENEMNKKKRKYL